MPVWEIIGPVMVGPSSSHTAGAAHIGRIVRMCWGGEIKKAALYMRGSFASTGAGHGTDKALVAGLMGMAQDDPGIRRAFELAREAGTSKRSRARTRIPCASSSRATAARWRRSATR